MKVEVRPIDTPKWHGKKGKESFTQPQSFEVLLNVNTGRYATGLTEEESVEYGKKLGVNLSDTFNPNQAHEFWGSTGGRVKLENNTMFLDTSKPLDFVRWKNMKASDQVANSMKEWKDGLWPDATHVITDESEEIEIKAVKIQQKAKATEIVSKMTQEDKLNIIQILSEKSMKGQSDSYITVELDDIIENKQEEFLRYAKLGKKELYVRAAILEAVHRNILTKEGSSIYYMSDRIGFDFDDTVKYFEDPQNQAMKIAILEKLK